MSKESASAEHNSILRALSQVRYGKLYPQMQPVTLQAGTVLYDVGELIKHVHFPRTALVSLVGLTTDGRGTEVAMVGLKVFLVSLFCLAPSANYTKRGSRSAVTCGSYGKKNCWRAPKTMVRLSLASWVGMAMVRLNQISQSAICNRFHSLKQRLCRWVLTAVDRTKSTRLDLTQEFLSQMIGARRPATAKTLGPGTTETGHWRERGYITILNQKALEATTCECYQSAKDELETFQRNSGTLKAPD